MVDAAGAILPIGDTGRHLMAKVHSGAEAIRIHTEVCGNRPMTPPQHPTWVSNWITHSGADSIVAALHKQDGAPVFSLPLEVVTASPVRIARYMSGRHANGNFPAMASGCGPVTPMELSRLAACIAKARPDIDLLTLERQAHDIEGATNPFAALSHTESPNPALAVSLAGGFDTVMGGPRGKRKRKKHRSQRRKFEALGAWRRFRASTPDETDQMLDAFFGMKRARFRALGVRDPFDDDGVQSFFRKLFGGAADQPKPEFFLHGLEVAGKLRAVSGSSVCAGRVVCEFSAFWDDDAAHASPGEFLFYENIREACELGMEVYDFSVGDEPYKRLWCDIEQTQFDCFLPLNAKGRVAALAYRTATEAKRVLKSNDALWQSAKKLRRTVAGK